MVRVIIGTWNVNSIRKRLVHLCEWLKKESIDVALLQETRCTNQQFPYDELNQIGYTSVAEGQKGRNGVAIISRYPVEKIHSFLPGCPVTIGDESLLDTDPPEARYIEGLISVGSQKIRVASVYVPNGREVDSLHFKYKLYFFDSLFNHLNFLISKEERIVVGGDYNVAPEAIDVFSSEILSGKIGFHIEERRKFRKFLNIGYLDAFRAINPTSQIFSWWNYRAGGWEKNHGMRIDHMLLSPQVIDSAKICKINALMRSLPEPSDHVPVEIELNL